MKSETIKPLYPLQLGKTFALAAIGLAVSAYSASASLTMDLRAMSVNGVAISGVSLDASQNPTTFGQGAHTVTGLNVGDVVYFELFATITGTTSSSNGAAYGIQSVYGSVTQNGGTFGTWTAFANPNVAGTDPSPGGVQYAYGQDGNGNPALGNGYTGGNASGSFDGVNGTSNLSVFSGNGSQTGKIQDLNADGHQDIGSNGNAPTDTNLIFARSPSMLKGNARNGNLGFKVSNFSQEFLVGSVQLTITGLGTTTNVNWNNVPSPSTFTGTAALWFENNANVGVGTGATTVGTLLDGTGVTLIAVPEPATWAMLLGGVATLVGFQRFRRKA